MQNGALNFQELLRSRRLELGVESYTDKKVFPSTYLWTQDSIILSMFSISYNLVKFDQTFCPECSLYILVHKIVLKY